MRVENKTVKNYPTTQMVKRQEWLKYLDNQRQLKEYVRQTYSREIVEERGLIYVIFHKEAWDFMTIEEQQTIIRCLVNKVVITDNKVKVVLNI